MFRTLSASIIKRYNINGLIARRSYASAVVKQTPKVINRNLPDPESLRLKRKPKRIAYTGLYIVGLWVFAELIFNNERSDNASVNNTLLELRRNKEFRDILGNNIRLDGLIIPWIYGTMNQVEGNVDIHFDVVGTKNKKATVFFKAEREANEMNFNIVHWYFTLVDQPDVKYDLMGGQKNMTANLN